MPDEVKTFSGSLVLDLRIWWRHVHTLYWHPVCLLFFFQSLCSHWIALTRARAKTVLGTLNDRLRLNTIKSHVPCEQSSLPSSISFPELTCLLVCAKRQVGRWERDCSIFLEKWVNRTLIKDNYLKGQQFFNFTGSNAQCSLRITRQKDKKTSKKC